jgi:hypothetical protein
MKTFYITWQYRETFVSRWFRTVHRAECELDAINEYMKSITGRYSPTGKYIPDHTHLIKVIEA